MDYKAFYAEVADWIMQVNQQAMTYTMESADFWTWVSKSMGELSNKYGNNNLVVNQMSMLFVWLEQKLIEEVANIATLEAIEVFNAQKEEEGKKQRDRRLRNTKLLLKNYREFKLYLNKVDEDAKVNVPKILVSEGENIIDLMSFGEDIVSTIKQISKKTIAMIQYTDRALETLEFMYERENNSNPFEILSKRYVEGLTIVELADMFN